MDILFLILACLAGVVHSYIFLLETFLWTKPVARRTFGTTEQHAKVTKEMAANQGVYNGALACVVFVGVAVFIAGNNVIGQCLILAGTSIMTVAAMYLFVSSPDKRLAAIKQLVFPLSTIVIGVLNLL